MSLSDVITVGVVTVVGLAFLGAGLAVASVGLGRIRTARGLREAGPISLREVPDASGLVEFEGTARTSDEGTLQGPLSGADCLAFTAYARSRDDAGGDDDNDDDGPVEDDRWTLEGQASASVSFAVEDGDDRVEVDPTNAVLSLDDREPPRTSWIDDADLAADTRHRLAAVGLAESSSEVTGGVDSPLADRQYRERRLEPGDDVHVFGGVVDSSDPTRPVTVAGDDWFEISVGDRPTVLPDRRRSGTMYLVFGGLIAVPGTGFTLAGIAGLVSTLFL